MSEDKPTPEERLAYLEMALYGVDSLRAKAKNLVDAVSSDDTGKLVGGQWMAGNGGLLSRATIAAADALRLELARWSK